MVLQKTWNNTVYNIPQSGERGWATLTNFLVALADGAQTTGKQIIGRRTAIASPVTVTATTDCYIGVNVALAPAAVNLPVGVNGQVFIIGDESGAAGTYNITLNPNGANTINGTTSYVMDLDKQVVYLVFNNGNWVVLSTGTSSAPITGVTDSATIDFTLTPGNLSAIVKLDSLDNTHINSAAGIVYTKLDLTDGIVDADVNTAAAIAYVKLNLVDGIVNADINSAAAIDYSKLNLSGSIVNADVNASAAIVYSKLNLTASIVDADVAAAAAIARSKVATGTADHVVINSGTGALSSEAQLAATRGGTGVSSTATFPTSGVVVTEAGTQTLTNKTLSGAITSNYQQFTNTTVPATPPTGSTRIYASSVDKKFHYVDDAGTDTVIGSGSGGGGGKNYLTAYSDFDTDPSVGMVTNLTATGNRASNTTVWGANTTALLSQTSTALRGLKAAQIVNGSSASNFIESPMFTLDTIDVNTNQLFISFDMNAPGNPGDWLVQVVRYNSSGTFQENIAPSITNLPSGYYNFKAAFSHSVTAGDQYALRFRSNTATARTLTIDTLVVGPQVVVDSAAVGGWIAYTPTIGAGFGTVSNLSAFYRRVGDTMEVQGSFTSGTIAAATSNIFLPGAFTIDSSKVSLSSNAGVPSPVCGTWTMDGAAAAFGSILMSVASTTSAVYISGSATGSATNTPATAAAVGNNNKVFAFQFKVPISQWTTNVTLAGQAQIEYAFNSDVTNTDTTASGYATGAQGVQFGNFSLSVNKVIQFSSPIQPTDRIVFEVWADNMWLPLETGIFIGSLGKILTPYENQNTANYGVILRSNGVANQMYVLFGTYASATGASFGAAGTAWSGVAGTPAARWRVAKYSAVGLAELAPATTTSVGTISRECNWTAYTPTFSGVGTPSAVTGFYKVMGDSLFLRITYTAGTSTSSAFSATFPTGFTLKTTAVRSGMSIAGIGAYGSVVTGRTFTSLIDSTNTGLLYCGLQSGANAGLVKANGNDMTASGETLSLFAEVPIN